MSVELSCILFIDKIGCITATAMAICDRTNLVKAIAAPCWSEVQVLGIYDRPSCAILILPDTLSPGTYLP